MARDMTSSRALYSRLLSYVRPYWKAFLAAMICMGLASLAEPVFPAMMKYMLDDGFAKAQGSWAWLIYPLIILAIFFARAIFGFLGEYAMSWVANNVITELRQAMFAHLMRAEPGLFVRQSASHLTNTVVYEVQTGTTLLVNAMLSLLKDSLTLVALMSYLLYINWKLTLIVLFIFPAVAWVMKVLSRRLHRITLAERAA